MNERDNDESEQKFSEFPRSFAKQNLPRKGFRRKSQKRVLRSKISRIGVMRRIIPAGRVSQSEIPRGVVSRSKIPKGRHSVNTEVFTLAH